MPMIDSDYLNYEQLAISVEMNEMLLHKTIYTANINNAN